MNCPGIITYLPMSLIFSSTIHTSDLTRWLAILKIKFCALLQIHTGFAFFDSPILYFPSPFYFAVKMKTLRIQENPRRCPWLPSTPPILQPIPVLSAQHQNTCGCSLPKDYTSIPLRGQLHKQVSPSRRLPISPLTLSSSIVHSLPRVILLICNSYFLPSSNSPGASHHN